MTTLLKKFSTIALLLFCFVIGGCSSAPSTPQDQLTEISKMLSKGYEIADQERREIDAQVNKAKELLKSGATEEAGKILATVLTDLELLAETDRFNKSE